MRIPWINNKKSISEVLDEPVHPSERETIVQVLEKFRNAVRVRTDSPVIFPGMLSEDQKILAGEVATLVYRDWLISERNAFSKYQKEIFWAFNADGICVLSGFLIHDEQVYSSLLWKARLSGLDTQGIQMENSAIVDFIASNPFLTGISSVRMLSSMCDHLKSLWYSYLFSYTGYPTTYKTYEKSWISVLLDVSIREKHDFILSSIRHGNTEIPDGYELWDRFDHIRNVPSKLALSVPEEEFALLFKDLR